METGPKATDQDTRNKISFKLKQSSLTLKVQRSYHKDYKAHSSFGNVPIFIFRKFSEFRVTEQKLYRCIRLFKSDLHQQIKRKKHIHQNLELQLSLHKFT